MDYSTKINNPLVRSHILKGGEEKALLSSRMLASKCRWKIDQKNHYFAAPSIIIDFGKDH